MKKGQATEALLYVAGGIIAALAIYYGVTSVIQLKGTGEKSSLEILKSTIRTDMDRMASQLGSNRTFQYNLAGFTRICFSDTTKNIPNITSDLTAPAVIKDSAASNSSNNVFLLDGNAESFYGGEIKVCKKNFACFDAVQGTANVKVYGGGGYALFEPCETAVSVPYVTNWTTPASRKFELHAQDFGESANAQALDISDCIANATDPAGNLIVSTKWTIVNLTDGSKKDFGEKTITPGARSVIANFKEDAASSFKVSNFGRFRVTLTATNNLSRQGSFTFVRDITEPGKNYPTVKITGPDVLNVSPTITPFTGEINDEQAGILDYKWDFGNGLTATGSTPFLNANTSYSVAGTSTYTYRDVSVLVKLTATNRFGLSASDTRRYTVGNPPPWVFLTEPEPEKEFQSPAPPPPPAKIPITFKFTPYDNEESTLQCVLLIDGGQYPLGELPSNEDAESTQMLNAPAVVGERDRHFWAVSCSDGTGTNSSETRRFTIIGVPAALPVFGCTMSTSCDLTKYTQMFALSDWSNAHVTTTDSIYYPVKLCCNLMKSGDSKNYLQNNCASPSTPFVSLSASSNAHASAPGVLASNVCFKKNSTLSNDVSVSCAIKDTPCGTGEMCIMTLYNSTGYFKAHAASCSILPYDHKVCCKLS